MTGTPMQLIRILSESPPDKKWVLDEFKEKRSLNANSYYWVLIGKLAEKLRISTARLHNTYLRDCGYVERIGEELATVFVPDTDEAETAILESSTYHLYPTSYTQQGKNGTMRCYALLRGSHTFNRVEMSRLIDLAVSDAKEQGIDTLTPEQYQRMMDAWEKRTTRNQ